MAGASLDTLRHVFITHHHSDHNADYGTLLLLAWASDLARPVDTWGPPPLEKITRLFLEMSDPDIKVRMADEGRPPLAPLVRPHEITRDGTVFELPGIVLRVAQECSGIRSSWVLLIAGLLASHLLLKTRWRRILLVAFVIPLGILRNGFRILVIGLLCVHVGPHMVNSIIHRRGGPFFFALSLVPLLLLLWWLRRQEQSPNLQAEDT